MSGKPTIEPDSVQYAIDRCLAGLTVSDEHKDRILANIQQESQNIRVVEATRINGSMRRLIIGIVAACLCLIISIPILGSTIPIYNDLIHAISPNLAEMLMPPAPIQPGNESTYGMISVPDPVVLSNISVVSDTEHVYLRFVLQDADADRLAADRFAYAVELNSNILVDYVIDEEYDALVRSLTVTFVCPDLPIIETPDQLIPFKIVGITDLTNGRLLNTVSVDAVPVTFVAHIVTPIDSTYRSSSHVALSPLALEFVVKLDASQPLDYELRITYTDGSIKLMGATITVDGSINEWQIYFPAILSDIPNNQTSPTEDAKSKPVGESVELEFFSRTVWMDTDFKNTIFFLQPLNLDAITSVELLIANEEPIEVIHSLPDGNV